MLEHDVHDSVDAHRNGNGDYAADAVQIQAVSNSITSTNA